MAVSGSATADPTPPTLVNAAASVDEVTAGLKVLTLHAEEPVGLAVPAGSAASVAQLKLVAGDVVRSIDGRGTIGTSTYDYDSLIRDRATIYLEVTRGASPLLVRIAIKPAPTQTVDLDLDRFSVATAFIALPGGKGVTVTGDHEPFLAGDVLRSLDGKALATTTPLETALQHAKDGQKLAIKLERNGFPIAMTVRLVVAMSEAELAGAITKVDDTHYTIKRDLIDKILGNPMSVSKGARVVPAVHDGKAEGFKLYAIRPGSLWAALGLQNGDTIRKINGLELTSADKALEAYTKLREATTLSVEITRRGQPITLTYSIK